MDIKKEYERWLANATADGDVLAELKTLDDAKIEDAFYRDLTFGTGGLRGVIGAGTNRMNIYTVAKASQGLADYLKKNYEKPSVVIGYDSRIKSDVFAKVAAGVFAANGVKVNIWPVLMPVPTVSFATRYLHTSAGVMVTASHNPSKYNGYKVYGADGCQITTEVAAEILAEIEKLDIFADVKTGDFEAGVADGSIQYIPDEVYTAFVEQVKSQSVLFGEKVNKDVASVYSPLNGTGLKPVTRTLKEMGYTNITVVKEQEQPDGNFPTCPYPNPEIQEAMALGMEYAKKCNADLLLVYEPAQETWDIINQSDVKLTFVPIGRDALVFIVNEENPVQSLTQQQLRDIYAGRITSWKDVGGADSSIVAFQRGVDSGSQTLFKKLLIDKGDGQLMAAPTELAPADMGGLVDSIAEYNNSANAIGFSVYYYIDQMYSKPGLRLLAVDGVTPSNETIADQSYPLCNEFYAAILQDSAADSPERRIYEWLSTDAGRSCIERSGYVAVQ